MTTSGAGTNVSPYLTYSTYITRYETVAKEHVTNDIDQCTRRRYTGTTTRNDVSVENQSQEPSRYTCDANDERDLYEPTASYSRTYRAT